MAHGGECTEREDDEERTKEKMLMKKQLSEKETFMTFTRHGEVLLFIMTESDS